jgi:co-chaperonin GroES (HSP10)
LTIAELEQSRIRDDLVLIEPIAPHTSKNGIILPDITQLQQPYGKVLLTGSDMDVEPGDWVVYRRALAYDIREWDTEDKRAASFTACRDVLAILQPNGLIPLGRNIILDLPKTQETTDSGIILVNPEDWIYKDCTIAEVVDVPSAVDEVKVGDKVVVQANLAWMEVTYNEKTVVIVDFDELEAIVVGTD